MNRLESLRHQSVVAYVVAVVAVATAIGVKLLLDAAVPQHDTPFIPFFGAVMVAAWYGGRWPGVVATVLSAVGAAVFFLPSFAADHGLNRPLLVLAVFVAEGLLISLLCGMLHAARKGAIATAARAVEAEENARRIEERAWQSEETARRTQTAFDMSQQTFKRLVEANLFGVVESDLEGRIHSANDAFLATVQRTRAELDAGTLDWKQLSPPECEAVNRMAVEQIRRTGRCEPFEKAYVRPDGTRVPVLVGGAQVFGADRAISFVLDLSERKTAEHHAGQSARINAAIIDGALGAVVRADASSRIISWNGHAETLFGWTRNEALGRLLTETIIPPGFRDAHLSGMTRFLQTGQGPILGQRIEVAAIKRDGSEFPIELIVTPVETSGASSEPNTSGEETARASRGGADARKRIEFVASIRDISDRKQHEADLNAAKEAAEQAAHVAEQANRTKSEFLANISHELRTPMNAILGMTNLALGEELSLLTRDYLETSHTAATALLYLLNDLLDFSRMEAGRFELETAPFSLRETLDTVLKTLAIRADEKRLELACHVRADVPDTLLGDPHRLQQVVMNIAGNAIKFTDSGEVVLDVAVAPIASGEAGCGEHPVPEQPGDDARDVEPALPLGDTVSLCFAVRDTGIGIKPDDLDRIFTPFTQADASTTRRYAGTGLGLTISQELVTLMGGSIGVASTPGSGSTFHWTACFGRPHADFSRRTIADLQGLRALVVDDNATNRRIVMEMLHGWQVDAADSPGGAHAVQLAQAASAAGQPFGLILVDALMPDIDGFMLLDQFGRAGLLTGVTIVMLSSADRQVFERRSREMSLDGYLVKPVSQSDLLDAILTALKIGVPVDAESSAEPTVAEAITGRPLRILLAEDVPANQKVVRAILAKRGHKIDLANNGREALDAHLRGNYEVILMDVQMPGMDGLQATAAIRSSRAPGKSSIPILAMTAHAMRGDRERCLHAGMDGYLTKPIDAADLIAQIESLAVRRHVVTDTPKSSEVIATEVFPETALSGLAPAPPPADASGFSMPAFAAPPLEESRMDNFAAPLAVVEAPSHADGPPYMREIALERLGGDAALLAEFLESVLDDAPGMMSQLRSALATGDTETAHRLAHGLKGMLATLEARPATEAAAEIEELTKTGDPAAITVADRLELELERLAAVR